MQNGNKEEMQLRSNQEVQKNTPDADCRHKLTRAQIM